MLELLVEAAFWKYRWKACNPDVGMNLDGVPSAVLHSVIEDCNVRCSHDQFNTALRQLEERCKNK